MAVDNLPEQLKSGELFLGTTDGQWPVHTFTTEAHAVSWMTAAPGDSYRRRIWRCSVEVLAEMEVTPPVARTLVEKKD